MKTSDKFILVFLALCFVLCAVTFQLPKNNIEDPITKIKTLEELIAAYPQSCRDFEGWVNCAGREYKWCMEENNSHDQCIEKVIAYENSFKK